MYVDDIKLAGKKQNIDPMWKLLNKEVDLGEPTSFLNHVYLGCTQRQCEISKDVVDNYRTMFESIISAAATEKFPWSENLCNSRRLNQWLWRSEKWLLDDLRRIHLLSSRCTPSQTVRAARRNISYSDEVHRRYQNIIYITWRIVGRNRSKITEMWMDTKLTDTWKGFTGFTILDEKPPDGYTWSGWKAYEETKNLKNWQCVARYVERCVWRVETQRKAKVGSKNRSLTMLENYVVFHWFSRCEVQENLFKNAWKNLEVPKPAAMLCKIRRGKHGETCSSCGTRKTKYACIVEADESTRKRLERTLNKDHEDHIAGWGMNSLNHYNLVRESILMLKATKIPDAAAAVDKESEKLEKIPAWQLTKVRNKQRGHRWSKERMQNRALCVMNGTPRWHCKRWFRLLRSVYRERLISVTNDGTKSNGCQSMTTRMRRTSSGRNISLHPGHNGSCTVGGFLSSCAVFLGFLGRVSSKTCVRVCFQPFSGQNGRCINVIKNSKVRMSWSLNTSTKAQNGQDHGPVWKTPSLLSKGICTVILRQDFLGKRIRESFIWTRLGESSELGMFIREPVKGLLLSLYVDDVKLAGKKQNMDPIWKVLMKDVGWEEPTSFLDRKCETSRKNTRNKKPRFNLKPPWHGRSCKEMRGKILRTCE